MLDSQQKVQGHNRTTASLNLGSQYPPPQGKLGVELKYCHTDPCGKNRRMGHMSVNDEMHYKKYLEHFCHIQTQTRTFTPSICLSASSLLNTHRHIIL